jgi:6-phosphogluconolactonase
VEYGSGGLSGGSLTSAGSFPTGNGPLYVAVDPVAPVLYVVLANDFAVAAYALGTDGSLTFVDSKPTAGFNPESVAIDPTGRFAYAGAVGGNSAISEYSLASNGALTSIGSVTFPSQVGTQSLTFDRTGHILYVAEIFANTLAAYGLNTDGTLTLVTSVVTGALPDFVVADPRREFVYTGNYGDSTVSAYHMGRRTGTVTSIPGSPFASGGGPESMAIRPDGGEGVTDGSSVS